MEPTLIRETKTVTTEEVIGVAVPLMKSELHDLLILARHFPWDLADSRLNLPHVPEASDALRDAWNALGRGSLGNGRPGMERIIREAFKALDEKNERAASAVGTHDRAGDPDTVTLVMNRTEAETLRRILGATHADEAEKVGGDHDALLNLQLRMGAEIAALGWGTRVNEYCLVAQ